MRRVLASRSIGLREVLGLGSVEIGVYVQGL